MSDRLLSAVGKGVMALSLNRPAKRNALDQQTIGLLGDALEAADLDASVRVVTIQGAGTDFCAGADLNELLASADRDADANQQEAMRLGNLFIAMRHLPKPVVALVRGRALAGGCGLATACDLVFAHTDAQFGYPEVRRGFVPAMVMAMLRRAVGEKRAFDLVATGRLVSAAEAMDMGLVSRTYSDEEFEARVERDVDSLAQASPTALALIKRQLYELDGLSFVDAIRLGARVNAVARSTPDFRAAVEGFLKRS